MTFYVTGLHSSITTELLTLMDAGGVVEECKRLEFNYETFTQDCLRRVELTGNKYFFAAGVLRPKKISDQKDSEIKESLIVNLTSVVQACELILEHDKYARIVIMGSESGIKGSYDTTYALSKAAIHNYIVNKKLNYPYQQIVGIAPTIILDAGMTLVRSDFESVKEKGKSLPKGRWLMSKEVAELAYFLLYKDKGYITNTVIEMTGGKRAGL